MRIQHNIMAMNAYRNYNNNNKSLSGNLEKLSAGYKINRAGDDAAGLAISEKMRAQITGLDAAQKNVKDGISLVKTAEGAMQEIQDMLNRMDYLATQSANGTYDNEVDRANLNKEVTALKSEINRIADSANFNGIKLLDGTWAKEVTGGDTDVVDPGKYDMTDLTMKPVNKNDPNASVDGKAPTEAKAATMTVRLGAGSSLADLAGLETGVTYDNGGTTATYTIGDLFDAVDADGNSVNLNDNAALTKAKEITLVAKTEGSMGNDFTTIKNAINASGTNMKVKGSADGVDLGGGGSTATVQAEYTFTLDLTKIKSGTTIQIGGETAITFTNKSNPDASKGEISLQGLDLDDPADQLKLAQAINDALDKTNGTGTNTDFESEYDGATLAAADIQDGTFTFTLTANANLEGTAGNVEIEILNDDSGAVTYGITAGRDEGTSTGSAEHAKAVYTYDPKSLKAGNVITIGDKTIQIVADDTDAADMKDGMIKESDIKGANASDKLNSVLKQMGYEAGTVTIDAANKTISVEMVETDDVTAADWAKGDGKVQIGTPKPDEKPEEPVEPEDPKGGKTLTLQIGDTADKFNQLGVNIGDMHTKAMGTGKATIDGKEVEITETIDDIDISSQEGAQKAIYSIRNAINTVSSVRGDLGAVQNRLDHTANNLSVMAENIQDAESTIRDTDVANEMMSYVKNNILVQSAQAMLAQANQVPQGVLQLLG